MSSVVIFVIVFIVLGLIGRAKQRAAARSGRPNPRVQAMVNRIQAQAQQNGGPPLNLGPQFAQYTNTASTNTAPTVGFNAPTPPGQPQYPAPSTWLPTPQAPPPPPITYQQQNRLPAHRPPQNNLPSTNKDLDARVRELMRTANEVGAIRLLCDERDLGIIEAQKYARNLVRPAKPKSGSPIDGNEGDAYEETRYVGSAAFASSMFDLDREEDVWASGWVDTPEPEDRSDIDELWQTVKNPPRPGTTPSN